MSSMNYLVLILVFILSLPGCSLLQMKHDIGVLEQSVEVRGEVAGAATDKPVFVAHIRDNGGKLEIVNYSVQYGPGPFHFLMSPGTAFLFAFQDINENLIYEKGEPAAWYGGHAAKKIVVKQGELIDKLVITLDTDTPEGVDEVARPERTSNNKVTIGQIKYSLGELIRLDDRRFTEKRGAQGLFEPVQSLNENGVGIYFLEPYDPAKVPVLFVHGAGGYAGEFGPMIESMDHEKFQAWVLQYPSGMRLDISSDIMTQALVELYARYKFDHLAIVAHSMGGLVSRAAINKIETRYPFNPIRMFITLSTPWDGVESARLGVERSPLVVPCWIDIAPGSVFLTGLFKQPLPHSVRYYQLFGVVGGNGTDGAVPLTSVGSLRAQADSVRIFAYPETHAGILKSNEAIRQVHALLADVTS